MSLCRYLPVPSDRMAIIWSLLSVKNSLVLEYGPAGTTHFSMGLYGTLGIDFENRLFTTHMSEDDVVMGDVTRLENAIKELDASYEPEVIFVVASSVSAVIGTDIKGVCNYMQNEVKTKLVSFEQGGFRGDYGIGLNEVYKLLVKNLPQKSDKIDGSYNILGASMGRYRMESDVWEVQNLMRDAFGMQPVACLCCDTTVEQIKNMAAASLNLVFCSEALEAAEYLKEKFGTPYVYCPPYGYKKTMAFLQQVSAAAGKPIAPALMAELGKKTRNFGMLGMYAMMGGLKKRPQAVVKADYDTVCCIAEFLKEAGFDVTHKICSHALKSVMNPVPDVKFYADEKERLDIFRSLQNTLVLADDISIMQCDNTNTCLRISAPVINGSQVATHLPFMGIKGADYLMETIELYYQQLY